MSDLLTDLRVGGRLFFKAPGYSLVVLITLALAIGANAIIFSFTDLLLLAPLPFGAPDRTVFIYNTNPLRGIDRGRASLPDFLDWRDQAMSVEQMAAFGDGAFTLTGQGEPLRISALRSTANLFALWDLRLAAGRAFLPGDDAPGAPKVAVLSDHFWAARFNRNPDIVGRTLMLNGEPNTVVGVVTPAIEVGNFASIDLWLPLTLDRAGGRRDDRWLRVTARMKPATPLDRLSREMTDIARRLERSHPDTNGGWSARPLKLRDAIVGNDAWQVLALLTIVVFFVLVVACANVANMTFARAIARQKEMAVRIALGATRSRLVRQIVTEGLVLGVAGGLLGIAVARAGIRAIQTTSADYIFQHLTISGHLLVFTFGLSVLAPMMFSLLPALHAARTDLNESLKDAGRRTAGGKKSQRSRAMLVISQLALALMLLVVATLASRSVAALKREPPGIQTSNLLTVQVQLEAPKYRRDDDAVPFAERVVERLASLPGVRSAAAMTALPLVGREGTTRFHIAERPAVSANDTPWAIAVAVSPEYAGVFDLRLIGGRGFSRFDSASSPQVALVSSEAVRRYWPMASPLGQHVVLGDERAAFEIVGIVNDVKGEDPADPAPPRIYRTLAQAPQRSCAFVVRTLDEPTALAPATREALRAVDPDVAIPEMQSLDHLLRERFAENYVLVGLFASFALLALVMAGTGLYGVTAYAVSQRTQEIGIRMALGATQSNVLSLVLGQNARVVAIGSFVGVFGGVILGRSMRSILFRVGPTDPLTFSIVIAILGGIALLASYIPARRASHIDPLRALHHE